MEKGNFRLYAANGKRKRQTSVCLLQTETENISFFSMVGKQQTVIDDCCFSKRAHLAEKYIKNILSVRLKDVKPLSFDRV
jgi:hypothetical protein